MGVGGGGGHSVYGFGFSRPEDSYGRPSHHQKPPAAVKSNAIFDSFNTLLYLFDNMNVDGTERSLGFCTQCLGVDAVWFS